MTHLPTLYFLGYCSGLGAENIDCARGPLALQAHFLQQKFSFPYKWLAMLSPLSAARRLTAVPAIAELSARLAAHTCGLSAQGENFLVFGGDHSSAIGTWSGVAHAIRAQGNLGLIWIDAHMDSHTPQTSLSQNVHGMPLAALLGYGDPQLTELLDTQPKVLPQNICLIGVRSFEEGEAALLHKLGVRIFYMQEVHERGIKNVLQDAIMLVKKSTVGFGVSLDLDAIDPSEAPGTGAAEANGISAGELCSSLAQLLHGDKKLLGFEISEYDPSRDIENCTANLVHKLVDAVYNEETHEKRDHANRRPIRSA